MVKSFGTLKRALKILGITLCSIIVLLLLVVGTALWVVFTPERLTPIVRNVASDYVTCEHKIGKVELTFFSTFPQFGLNIDSLILINPTPGAPSDTLLVAPHLTATVDVQKLLNEKLHIHALRLPDIQANVYINEDGIGNFDIFNLPPDTTTVEDTTAPSLPFREVVVDELHLSARQLQLLSLQDSIDASIRGLSMNLDAESTTVVDMHLLLAIASANVSLQGVTYAQQLSINADIPAQVDIHNMGIQLQQARMAINEFEIALNGGVNIQEDIRMDMRLALQNWQIADLLALLPPSLQSSLNGITADGRLSLEAQATGVYNDSIMPIVDAHLLLQDGKGQHAELPYTFYPLNLDANLHLDMQNPQQTQVKINHLLARTRNSSIQGKGMLRNPLGKMWIDMQTKMDVCANDAKQFLPEDMIVQGRIKGKLNMKMYLDDLTAMRLEKGKLSGDLQLQGIRYQTDSMLVTLPDNHLTLQIPNANPSRPEVSWLSGQLHLANGQVEMTNLLQAQLSSTNLAVEMSNILGNDPRLHATLALESSEQIHALMDSMDITLAAPTLTLDATYNMQDSLEMPSADVTMSFERLYGYYTDIHVDLEPSTLSAGLHAPRLNASIQTKALRASMGQDLSITTQEVDLQAAAKYSSRQQDNILLQWRPQLTVDLNQAEVTIADWEQKLLIPDMDFSYSNKELQIQQSQLILGNSDFQLTGQVQNIGRWLRKRGTLTGELNFISNHTDADELLALFSADQGSEEVEVKDQTATSEETATEEATTEREPFLVPKNVDLTLNTQIKQANFYQQTAHNLGGKIYIKDGMLVLEEVGFICNAAKLQLTAMYRTPRRNHIYLGFDYHMIDINIQELISMIPEIDSMMPMLRSFQGAAEFHLAAETYTNAQYEIKPSTLRGAASIYGKDLVVMDSETFRKISKLLMFSKKTNNVVDSISAEITLYKKEIDVYPFCVSMDNYMVALGGRHNLDMSFNYDVNVLSPIHLGVNVSGTLEDLKIKLAKCKYAKDFKPTFNRKVDTQSAELRSIIRESMRKNVKM